MSRDPQQFSGEAHDEWLGRAFDEWNAGEPSAKAWETLDASLSADAPDGILSRSFDEWNAGEPSAKAWEAIDESLSVEAVWNRVGQSLVAEEHLPDEWIAAAHTGWNPEQENDGWDKLNEAISLEQVWRDLDQSLSQPIRTRIPIWKLAAASIAALFMAQQFNDTPITQNYTAEAGIYMPAGGQMTDSPATNTITTSAPGTISYTASGGSPVETQERTSNQQRAVVSQDQLPEVVQQPIAVVNPENPEGVQTPFNGSNPLVNNPFIQVPVVIGQDNRSASEDLADWTMDSLQKRSWSMEAGDVAYTQFPIRPLDYKHWTVQLGTQLSVLQERNQASLTSTVPQLGLAADVSYRHRLGSLQFMHALGMSQYAQGVGSYNNGRFETTNQRINTLQFSSSIGHTFKRFTFYGGIMFSKVLSGQEKSKKKVVNMYNFDEVQTGFTTGIDCRVATFKRSGNVFSLGTQYQWLPTFIGKKTAFENIQGIRLQAKISF